jgi:hypothetical protein
MDDLNFGFKKGYSTNEAITMIQVLVDIANSKTKHKTEISFSSGFWVRSGIEIWVRKVLTSRLNISYIYLIFALISR